MSASDDKRWFRFLDRAFFAVWAALPVMIGIAIWSALHQGEPLEGMTSEQIQCLKILPTISSMSSSGQAIVWTLFAFNTSIYVVLLAFLHGMVRRFARERIFVSETLASLWQMGVILIVWPFLETGALALASFALWEVEKLPFSTYRFNLDIAPIAVGLFLLATQSVIRKAIALKQDSDLTI
ncbi:MAG: DUF2975 domain-containing protein [Hyphomicrobiaceae bacterium]